MKRNIPFIVTLLAVTWRFDTMLRLRATFKTTPFKGGGDEVRTEVAFINLSKWLSKGLHLGAEVVVEMGVNNNVYIVDIIQDGKGELITIPQDCPYCGELLVKYDQRASPTCTNVRCEHVRFEDIKYFAQKIGIPYLLIRDYTLKDILREHPDWDVDFFYRVPDGYWEEIRRRVTPTTKRLPEYIKRTIKVGLYDLLVALRCPFANPKTRELIEAELTDVFDLYLECFKPPRFMVVYYRTRTRRWFNNPVIQARLVKLYQVGFKLAYSPYVHRTSL